MTALRVLLVDDSDLDVELAVRALRTAGNTVAYQRVEELQAMQSALAEPWDIVLCDWLMPRFTAQGALTCLRERRIDTPFVILSGSIGEEAAVDAMRAGAQDYVLKDRLGRLPMVVERAMRERAEREARQRSEEALQASEARFARLAECGLIAIYTSDVRGDITFVNEAFVNMFGYSREEITGGTVHWRNKIPVEFLGAEDAALAELRHTGLARPWPTEVVCKDGTRVPVLEGIAALGDGSLETMRFFLDLTEQKRAEVALKQSEDQLRHAQKMEAVGRLAGGVAHDFNNMLSVILSYADMLLGDMKAGRSREDVEQIRSAAARAADLTRQLLMFSRQQVVAPRVLDLNSVLENMGKMLRRLLGEDVKLAMAPGPELGYVRVDPSQLEQVVMNLIVNARDAMPSGGEVTLRTGDAVIDAAKVREIGVPGLEPGAYVELSVTDTGSGMDAATRARIFEPFFTTKEIGKGTGLGLSTVFGIVRQSGGFIMVDSKVGSGSTFRVFLPRASAELDSTRPQLVFETLRGNESILLVEDDESVRTVARGILERYGYRVIEPNGAEEAVRVCEGLEKVDVLLTDVVMPQMSGPDLAKRVRQLRPNLRVICMSGYTDDRLTRIRSAEDGIAYLQKPFTPRSLCSKLREQLDQKKSLSS